MANQPAQKHYFVKSDPTFLNVLEWIGRQRANNSLQITGYREIQLSQPIQGNDPDHHNRWQRMYDFSRTAHVTLRYCMLSVTGLLEYHDPDTTNPARERNIGAIEVRQPPPEYARAINFRNHLAQNNIEAQWFSAHYDMLFPHFHIENRLRGINEDQTRNFEDQLVVVDHQNLVVWNVITTLKVRRLRNDGGLVIEATPLIAVYRLELSISIQQSGYPFLPTQEEDRNIEEIQRRVRDFHI